MNPLPFALCLLLAAPAAAQSHHPRRALDGGTQPSVALPDDLELAGKTIAQYPHFQYTRTFNEGQPIQIAFDTLTHPRLAKRAVDVFVIDHDKLGLYLTGRKLSTLTARPLSMKLTKGGVQENTFLLDPGTLKGTGLPDARGIVQLGRGYDVVVDMNLNAALDPEDMIDGGLEGPGFYVVDNYVTVNGPGTKETGPYHVVEVLFDGGSNFLQEDIYFPENIAALGQVPLIVVSHGNGHNYQWYDHIGYHMASWGYVVMSHANNTGPGIETAATSTLRNTNLILGSLDTIAGGVLQGHVDGHSIVWIGHSRGGEGVVRAHRRLLNGTPLATNFAPGDVKLVSSIAPVDFLGPAESDVGSVPFHLWTGGADADVNGCADCELCQTFHQLDRADGTRFSISLHGVGHGDFHDGGGSSVAIGPCLVHRFKTHQIMRGILLPLVQFVLDKNLAGLDYLTRQYEEFRPLGVPDPDLPENSCVVVDQMYMPGPGPERRMIDDFQTEHDVNRSSSGGAVLTSPGVILAEGRYDDPDLSFTTSENGFMNGMTLGGPGDLSAGAVVSWEASDEWLMFEVPDGQRDLSPFTTLSFRAAQATRHRLTVAELGDVDFSVQLTDANLKSSVIHIAAYGGGIEEPYARGRCGTGAGWGNEFETIRIPLDDFRRDGNPIDLGQVVAITFLFGPDHGSALGRIGLDEIEFTQ